jgi:maltose-binding protein MalE
MCRNTEGSSLLPKSIQDRVENATASQSLWKKVVFGCASVAAILLLVHAVMHHRRNDATTISTSTSSSSSSSSKSPYTKFQPLNFEIWTSGGPGFIQEQD